MSAENIERLAKWGQENGLGFVSKELLSKFASYCQFIDYPKDSDYAWHDDYGWLHRDTCAAITSDVAELQSDLSAAQKRIGELEQVLKMVHDCPLDHFPMHNSCACHIATDRVLSQPARVVLSELPADAKQSTHINEG